MKGNYILVLKLEKDKKIEVGKLGEVLFKKGYYYYVGSALCGFEKRLKRYFKERRRHWHIDYLLDFAEIIKIILIPGEVNLEEEISERLSKKFKFVPKFGCTDKKSKSHLFYSRDLKIEEVKRVLSKIVERFFILNPEEAMEFLQKGE